MINSRNIDDLRGDVAANCRKFLDMCRAAGLSPLVTCTVRDQEQQDVYYKAGTGGKTVTFHKLGVGLAFDICKNVKGQEYSDTNFFLKAAEIGERMGFTWGGRWKNVDMPHFQWDAGKQYHDADIIAGRFPPTMPLWVEDAITAYKAIIKKHVAYAEATWQYLDQYKYAEALYKKWAESYK